MGTEDLVEQELQEYLDLEQQITKLEAINTELFKRYDILERSKRLKQDPYFETIYNLQCTKASLLNILFSQKQKNIQPPHYPALSPLLSQQVDYHRLDVLQKNFILQRDYADLSKKMEILENWHQNWPLTEEKYRKEIYTLTVNILVILDQSGLPLTRQLPIRRNPYNFNYNFSNQMSSNNQFEDDPFNVQPQI